MKKILILVTLVCLQVSVGAAQKSFYNKEYKVGFKSPPSAKLTTKKDDIYVAEESLKGIAKLSFPHPGKGLFDAEVFVAAGSMTNNACKALATADGDVRRRKFGVYTFDKTESVEGGMESTHPQEFYRIFHDGICYEVRMWVGMPKYSKQKLNPQVAFDEMYSILRTLYFR